MGLNILIVEDEGIVAMDMEMTLSEFGHRAFVATDIAGAQRILSDQQIDAAVLDWHLGGSASTRIGEILKESRIPFMLCSGSSLAELTELFRDVPYVSKPFRSEDLVKAVESLATPH